MSSIKIDDTDYRIEDLSDECKAQIASIRYIDTELARLQANTAALQTARMAYSNALKNLLEGKNQEQSDVAIEGLGDSISFES